MGLFHWGKKTDTPQQGKHLTQEELTKIWKEAYQANPKVYEKADDAWRASRFIRLNGNFEINT